VPEGPSDAELITATRAGDTEAFGLLYQRHVGAARRLANALTRDEAEAEDLVAEAFARVLTTLRAGRGPDLAIRPYLLTTLRNVFYDRTRHERRLEVTDDLAPHDKGEEFDDPAVASLERRLVARAFATLPERWQMVLWHLEVEGESAAEVAPLLGLTPNGVAALAYRARERLRQAYLREHLANITDETHRWTAERLGGYVRDGLSRRDRAKVEEHLRGCDRCALMYLELVQINDELGRVLAPLVLGTVWSGYVGSATASGLTAAASGGIAGWLGGSIDWTRRLFQGVTAKIGSHNAVVGGVGAAGVATVVAAVALLTGPEEPQQIAAPPPPQETTQSFANPDPSDPSSASSSAAPTASPSEGTESASPTPTDVAGSPPSGAPTLAPSLSPSVIVPPDSETVEFRAGRGNVLPITIREPVSGGGGGLPLARSAYTPPAAVVGPARVPDRSSEEAPLTLRVDFPPGFRLTGLAASDGWRCERLDGGARCERSPLAPGESSTAELKINIGREVSGNQAITVTVQEEGRPATTTTFQIYVAPAPPN